MKTRFRLSVDFKRGGKKRKMGKTQLTALKGLGAQQWAVSEPGCTLSKQLTNMSQRKESNFSLIPLTCEITKFNAKLILTEN